MCQVLLKHLFHEKEIGSGSQFDDMIMFCQGALIPIQIWKLIKKNEGSMPLGVEW